MNRLLYVISSLARSGPVNQMVSVLRHLPDWDVHVLALSDDPPDSRKSDLLSLGITVHEIPLRAGRFWLRGRGEFASFVDGLKPDLIHTSGIRGDWLGASVARDYPTVSTIHNIPWEDYVFTYGRMVASVMLPLHRRAWRRIGICVGVSAHVADVVKRWAPEIRICAVPNGIDMDVFGVKAGVLGSQRSRIDATLVRDDGPNVDDTKAISKSSYRALDAKSISNPSHRALDARSPLIGSNASSDKSRIDATLVRDDEQVSLRKELGLPETARIWLVTDHLNSRKDPLTLINGFMRFIESTSARNDLLIFAGDGELMDESKAVADGNPQIRFIGRVRNVPKWYASADFLISASLSEGLHLSHVEALATGLVCVVSDIAVRREVYGEFLDGARACLFRPGDVEGVCEAVRAALTVEGDFVAALTAYVRKEFDSAVMAGRYDAVYEEALESAR